MPEHMAARLECCQNGVNEKIKENTAKLAHRNAANESVVDLIFSHKFALRLFTETFDMADRTAKCNLHNYAGAAKVADH
jgi:hypothetical protein